MRTHSKPKPESSHLAWQTCPGSILRALGVPVMSIHNKQTQSAPTPTGKGAAGGAESYKQTQFEPDRPEGTPASGAGRIAADGTELYKQTQFARGDVKGQVLCGKRVMTILRRQGPGENKANPRHQADASGTRQSATARRLHNCVPRSWQRACIWRIIWYNIEFVAGFRIGWAFVARQGT